MYVRPRLSKAVYFSVLFREGREKFFFSASQSFSDSFSDYLNSEICSISYFIQQVLKLCDLKKRSRVDQSGSECRHGQKLTHGYPLSCILLSLGLGNVLSKGCLQNVIDDPEINSICSLKGRFREERKSILYLIIEVCCLNYKFTSEGGIVINNNARICLR